VPAATVYALLGKEGDGRSALIRCLLGEVRPSEGRVLIFGEEPRRARKRIALVAGKARRRRSIFLRPPGPDASLAAAVTGGADLLLLDDPAFEDPHRAREVLAEAVRRGRTVLFAASDPGGVELLAHRVGILAGGRLVLDEELMKLKHAFRRIRYFNEMTETRSEYGNELDAFDAVRVKVRGWGIEAIVSDFDEEKFARFRAMDGIREARAEALSLAEIFEAAGARGDRD
jgi:ABC-type multidrug transport system ATPase subunit